ncbi:UDP-glycosyltransferase 83A1-like [Vigna radiata var. radiata]|uniref:UDP-glycosyltransferase 83A1-like n=1 Tax=Vigna radiata var. radiata TaxID=3916 RepID=A0A1S3TT00_VIGRR|nr:UDP-glycosyltransferase 83A1-like [Vigna radiata var. radiata]
MGIPHFLCLPLPIQGHVNPLMQFSLLLAKHGCKVTFVHTEFSHKRANTAGGDNMEEAKVEMVTLPDGLDPQDDRSDVAKLLVSMKTTMPALLPKLIQDINASNVDNKITCIIVTINMGWALQVGNKMGIKGALLCPASATSLASAACIPNLIEDAIIDSQGLPTKNQEIQLSPNMPMMDTSYLPWRGFNKIFFEHLMQEMQTLKVGEWWLCICAGVPFLCWPCTTDQFLNKSYICDVWKIGVGLEKDETGIVSREEIKKKVDQLLVDEDIKGRSLKLKEMTINNIQEGGQSSKNLNFFMEWAK